MILVVDPDSRWRSAAAEKLGRWSVQGLEDLAALDRAVGEQAEDVGVVILGPGLQQAEALRSADTLQIKAPGVSVVMVRNEQLSPDELRSAVRSGVRDVLDGATAAGGLEEAVARAEGLSRRVSRRPVTGDAPREPGQLITVFSTKGGSGKSVVASNLAILLTQQTNRPVTLVDLDLQSGDLAIMLGLLPAWTIYDAAEQVDRLDAELLAGYLTPHRSKTMLLAAPLEPSLAEAVSVDAVRRVLRILKETTPYVVVDGPGFFTDQILASLDESDQCVLVASMDVPSIKNLKLCLQTMHQLGFARERLRIVLSRANSRVGLRMSEVEKTLGTTIDVAIPSSREVPLSVNQGVPLATDAKRSPVVAALAKLAESVRRSTPAPNERRPASPPHLENSPLRRSREH